MILLVDIGNSRIKWALAGDASLLNAGEAPHALSTAEAFRAMTAALPGTVARVFATNVGGEALAAGLVDLAMTRWGVEPEFVTATTAAHGVHCAYAEPSRLGADRWVALIAAHRLCAGPACVIDAGTTVTLDAVDGDGEHLGGLIMAGPRVVAEALHRETSGIGETSGAPGAPSGLDILGRSTEEAVANGTMLGLAGALDRALGAVSRGLRGDPTVYLTGGDAQPLSQWLETAVQYRANLVLEGLAFIAAES